MVLQRHEGGLAPVDGIHQQDAAVRRHGYQVAPPRRCQIAARRERAGGRRLVRSGSDHLGRILSEDGYQPLVGAEQLPRHADERLGPGEPHPPCDRDHASLVVHGVEGPVRSQRGLLDGGGHRVEASSGDVERHHLALLGDREQEVRFGVEPHHAPHRGQLSPHGARYFNETGQPVGPERPPLGGNANRQPRGARAGDDRLANYLFNLWLR